MTVPFSPLADIVGRWPVSYLDAIHTYLEGLAQVSRFGNFLINGGFDIWQRDVTFSASGYTADRWNWTLGAGNTGTVTRQTFPLGQTDVPRNPETMAVMARTVTAAAESSLEQRIESVSTLAGEDFSVSLWMKADAAISVTLRTTQHFGSGGAPSADVVTDVATFAVTTAWQLFTFSGSNASIAGKTLGTSGTDYFGISIVLPVAAGNVPLFLANALVNSGLTPGTFQPQPFSLTVIECARYYQRFIKDGPGTFYIASAIENYSSYALAGNNCQLVFQSLPMRAQPSVSRVGNWGLSNATAQPVFTASINGFYISNIATATGAVQVSMLTLTGYFLSAEL